MSETTEHPAPEPEREPAPAPEAPAPDAEPAEQTEEQKAAAEQERTSRGDRRFATVTAKLSAIERLHAQKEAEAAYWRQMAQQGGQHTETPEQQVARIEREADARAEERLLQRRFHEEGNAQYRDWGQKTGELIKMGADQEIAKMLIAMPGGVHVAMALSDDPEELQRITAIDGTERRAIALGRFAARVDGANSNGHSRAAAPLPVTHAPAPVRPVTGRASPVFNEYTASAQELADRYMKQNLEKQMRR